MKRILIITLALIFGLSAVGLAAGTFSGRWATDITITNPQTPVFGVSSVITVNYAISGWTFGSVSTLTHDWPDWAVNGWARQDFRADGALGAFTLTNLLRFVPATATFTFLRSTAAVALAGVDFETRFLVVGPLPAIPATAVAAEVPAAPAGTGLRFRVGGPVDDHLTLVRATAYFGSLAFDPDPALLPAWHAPRGLRTHALLFRGLDLDVRMRFFSFILDIDADFTCDFGFQDLTFTVPRFPLGVPGFTAGLTVTYTLAAKTVAVAPAFAVGEWVHFQPFISVVGAIDGLTLDGLRMVWRVDDRVTFTYEWDAIQETVAWWDPAPRIAGRRVFGPRQEYQQRIMIRSVMAPITFDVAFAWLHNLPAVPLQPMPMFPEDIELDLSAVVLPGFSLRTGVALRHALPLELSFGFTVDW